MSNSYYSQNDFQNLLELHEFIIKKVSNHSDSIQINVEKALVPHHCPCCSSLTSRVHDYRIQVIKDIPIYKKKTLIHYRKRRFLCTSCSKRFYESNDFVAYYQHKSSRLNLWVVQELMKVQSLKEIANYLHLSTPTISRILDSISPHPPSSLPKVIALDEFKGDASTGKYQCIFTDPDSRRTLDILPVRNEARLRDYFRRFSLEQRNQVQYAVIDMWRPYARVLSYLFPKAKIIIDRFHMVRLVLRSIEKTRIRIQKDLSKQDRLHFKHSKSLLLKKGSISPCQDYWSLRRMFILSPELERAYDLKENFYWFFESPNSSVAKLRLDSWIEDAESSGIPEFKTSITALKNWRSYILNSFDVPYSNGYTEGTNNKIKVIKRNAYGLRNFSRLRTRILLNT